MHNCTDFGTLQMHKRVHIHISSILLVWSIWIFTRLYYFPMDFYIWWACARFLAEREALRVDWARERNLYFRNVTRCCCKIWNINASQHSHNRARTNWAVRFILFLFQCVFIDAGTILSNGTRVVSIEILSLSLSFPLSFSFRYFSSRLFFRPLIYQTKMGREDATVAIITLLPRPNHS